MNKYLKYPEWQEHLKAAVLEFNPRHLPEKLRRAEDAIAHRVRELAPQGDCQERRMLNDGIFILQGVKEDRLGTSESK